MQKTLSIIIPAYNEEKNIPLIYVALVEVWKNIPDYSYEFIFVNDGSSDGSAEAVKSIIDGDDRVRLVDFSRNFGKEIATTAGIHAAIGDAVMMIDADLQHPPRLIPEFISKWEQGAEVVTGIRKQHKGNNLIKSFGSSFYYKIMHSISHTSISSGETDFRLIDRQVVDAFNALTERARMTRALINWLGFKRDYIEFDADERANGVAAYSFSKLIFLALSSFVSHSLLPLRLAGYVGMIITSLSFLLGSVVFVEKYIFHDFLLWRITGSAQLAIINVFLIGIVLAALGLIALYIENIHQEVINRPLYIVRKNK
jgi:dolichol-phosphate mannosyltransferase